MKKQSAVCRPSATNRPLNNEKGFTLIELIMVIVILGILAAVAVPKFVDLKGDAQNSVRDGVTGALKGSIMMLHGRYLISNTSTYDIDTTAANMDAADVTLATATTTTLTADIKGSTCTWTYTDRVGNVAASVATPTGC